MQQFIYRHEYYEALPVTDSPGVEFKLLVSPVEAIRLWRQLAGCFGLVGFVKAALKLTSRNRRLYCIIAEGAVAHYGWVSFSFCRYYTVQAGDVVVGPIWTSGRFRGRGYASLALMKAVNELVLAGHHVFWIDTSADNMACQKVIEKCGFGKQVSRCEGR